MGTHRGPRQLGPKGPQKPPSVHFEGKAQRNMCMCVHSSLRFPLLASQPMETAEARSRGPMRVAGKGVGGRGGGRRPTFNRSPFAGSQSMTKGARWMESIHGEEAKKSGVEVVRKPAGQSDPTPCMLMRVRFFWLAHSGIGAASLFAMWSG